MKTSPFSSRLDRTAEIGPGRFRTWFYCALILTAIAPAPAKGGFVGDYALANFTLTNTKLNLADPTAPNGTVALLLPDSAVLTGSNTGSALEPGATTDLTIASKGTGEVRFNWLYSSLDDPEFDIAGYLLGGVFEAFADSNGQFGLAIFQVTLGQTFGFRVRTLDNAGEPGVLTIRNFTAPGAAPSAVPEPSALSLTLMTLAGGGIAAFRRRMLNRPLHG